MNQWRMEGWLLSEVASGILANDSMKQDKPEFGSPKQQWVFPWPRTIQALRSFLLFYKNEETLISSSRSEARLLS